MTLSEFKIWFDGFYEGAAHAEIILGLDVIKDKLSEVIYIAPQHVPAQHPYPSYPFTVDPPLNRPMCGDIKYGDSTGDK